MDYTGVQPAPDAGALAVALLAYPDGMRGSELEMLGIRINLLKGLMAAREVAREHHASHFQIAIELGNEDESSGERWTEVKLELFMKNGGGGLMISTEVMPKPYIGSTGVRLKDNNKSGEAGLALRRAYVAIGKWDDDYGSCVEGASMSWLYGIAPGKIKAGISDDDLTAKVMGDKIMAQMRAAILANKPAVVATNRARRRP